MHLITQVPVGGTTQILTALRLIGTTDTNVYTWFGNVIGIPAGVAGIGIPLYLWLSGKIRLVSDADKDVDAVRKPLEEKIKEQDEDIIALKADRDAWKVAHAAEVEARQAASRAAAALLDSATLSNQLLDALREQMGLLVKNRIPYTVTESKP